MKRHVSGTRALDKFSKMATKRQSEMTDNTHDPSLPYTNSPTSMGQGISLHLTYRTEDRNFTKFQHLT